MKLLLSCLLLLISTFFVFFFAYDPDSLSPLTKFPKRNLAIAAPPFAVGEVIEAMARKHKIHPAIVKSIIAAESAFRPEVVSSKGALGLMQLMPETAQEMGADASIPEQNVEAGTRYLSGLLRRYQNRRDGMKLAIAAYNAGPGNVDRYHGIPPFAETRNYVTRVLKFYKHYVTEDIAENSALPRTIRATHRTGA